MQVVAGGGAVEAALSVYLEYLATTLGSREQLAIAEFAEALLIIPKVLDTYIHIFFSWLVDYPLLDFGMPEPQYL
jgi:TCP-1/cpn60 chaperonin family